MTSTINERTKSTSIMIDDGIVGSNKKNRNATDTYEKRRLETRRTSSDDDFDNVRNNNNDDDDDEDEDDNDDDDDENQKPKNLVTKLIFLFERKNVRKCNVLRERNADDEFLRRSFMRIPLPRINVATTYYPNRRNDFSSYDRREIIGSNEKKKINVGSSNANDLRSGVCVKTFENDIEIYDDTKIIADGSSSSSSSSSLSSDYRFLEVDEKEKWTTANKRWNDNANEEKIIDRKRSIKGVLSSLIGWKRNSCKNKSRGTRASCEKSYTDCDNVFSDLPIIPRARSLKTVVINNTMDKIDTNLNRSATIRPIYGIKRNETTPKTFLESFRSIKINPRKEDSGYGSGTWSVEESIENLVKPSTVREISKKLTFIPEQQGQRRQQQQGQRQHREQTWNHTDDIDLYRQVLSHCKRDGKSYQRKSFIYDELKVAVKKRFDDVVSNEGSIIYNRSDINRKSKRDRSSSLCVDENAVDTVYENISRP